MKKPGGGRRCDPCLPAFVFGFDFCLWRLYPVYVSGTATHALQRQHFAATRREAPSTRRMAFLITTSPGPLTTTLVPHTWQRTGASLAGAGASLSIWVSEPMG